MNSELPRRPDPAAVKEAERLAKAPPPPPAPKAGTQSRKLPDLRAAVVDPYEGMPELEPIGSYGLSTPTQPAKGATRTTVEEVDVCMNAVCRYYYADCVMWIG